MRSTYLLAAAVLAWSTLAHSQETCKNRGDLDTPYCDENGDLVADAPADPAKWQSPEPFMYAYSPIENSETTEKIFQPFTNYLTQCLGRRTAYFPVQGYTSQIEAMRSGRLHMAWFPTGSIPFAVNVAGAVPFATKGSVKGSEMMHLMAIVKSDSPYQKLSELKGKRVAHVSPTSNSGHLAPVALFPAQGLVPGRDYNFLFAGKHDFSILGVVGGEYDGAAVASDIFDRMVTKGQIKQSDFRVLYESQPFPTDAAAYVHNLEPKLKERLIKCIYDFRFPPEMRASLGASDRFVPVNFKTDWAVVRQVSESAGETFTREAYEKFKNRKK